jgi:hypothetical protein
MSDFSRSIRFNSLYIVQFLGPRDTEKTGEQLHSYLEPFCRDAEINLGYLDVSTSTEFLAALVEIVEHVRKDGWGPLLHIETHAHESGLGASRTEVLPWSAITAPLTELNRLSRMNLLVTMAACHGLNLVRTLHPGDEAPLWGVLGPDNQVMPSDIRNGFRAFYRTLITSLDLKLALDELRNADSSWPETWKFQNAELFLAHLFGEYLEKHATDDELARREDAIVKALGTCGFGDSPALRSSIRTAYRDDSRTFDHLKRRFLMLYRFPENESRFPLDLEEALRLRSLSSQIP